MSWFEARRPDGVRHLAIRSKQYHARPNGASRLRTGMSSTLMFPMRSPDMLCADLDSAAAWWNNDDMGTKEKPLTLAVTGMLLASAISALAQSWTLTSAPITNWDSVASSADGSRLLAAV